MFSVDGEKMALLFTFWDLGQAKSRMMANYKGWGNGSTRLSVYHSFHQQEFLSPNTAEKGLLPFLASDKESA